MDNEIITKFGKAVIDNKGHYRITSGKEGNHGKQLHRLIFEDYHKCTILKGIDCHHINENKTDNRISNLMLIPHSEHSRLHNTGDNNPKAMKGRHLTEEHKKKISEANKGKHTKSEPHILKGGVTTNGTRRYNLIVNSEVVLSSTDKNKLEQIMLSGDYVKYTRPHKYVIDETQLIQAYEDGNTMQELADMFGCSRKTISRRLHKYYSKDELKNNTRKNISKKLKGKMRIELPPRTTLLELKKKYTYKELSSMLGCAEKTIYERLKDNN